jgi:hypothetical protein
MWYLHSLNLKNQALNVREKIKARGKKNERMHEIERKG